MGWASVRDKPVPGQPRREERGRCCGMAGRGIPPFESHPAGDPLRIPHARREWEYLPIFSEGGRGAFPSGVRGRLAANYPKRRANQVERAETSAGNAGGAEVSGWVEPGGECGKSGERAEIDSTDTTG
jgi:hypothetical protein